MEGCEKGKGVGDGKRRGKILHQDRERAWREEKIDGVKANDCRDGR